MTVPPGGKTFPVPLTARLPLVTGAVAATCVAADSGSSRKRLSAALDVIGASVAEIDTARSLIVAADAFATVAATDNTSPCVRTDGP